MKTTNKIGSFLSGLIIAFAITLFLPSAANATWGNYYYGSHYYGSHYHGSHYCGSHNNKYKVLADKFKASALQCKTYADIYFVKYKHTDSCYFNLKEYYYTCYLYYSKEYKSNMRLYKKYMKKYNQCGC